MCSELSKTISMYNGLFETIGEARIVLYLIHTKSEAVLKVV